MNIKSKLKTVNISDIKPYAKNAKLHTNDQIELIKQSIDKYDYYSPIGVDKNNVIVFGHGRFEAIKEKQNIDKLEVVDLSYLSSKEIKKLRILDNKIVSNEWDDDLLNKEIEDIAKNMNKEYNEIAKELNIDLIKEKIYNNKMGTVMYSPSDICPEINELVNESKAIELIEEIKNTKIDDKIKKFLILGAYRHNIFDYSKIADFYVNQKDDIKTLMEKSALVIIDYGKAMENGYLKLKDDIIETQKELYENEVL